MLFWRARVADRRGYASSLSAARLRSARTGTDWQSRGRAAHWVCSLVAAALQIRRSPPLHQGMERERSK